MAATTQFYEDNGTATGSPSRGTPSTISAGEWKNIDDSTTPRANSPIVAGNNSYQKFNYLRFTGIFNQISAVKWAHTAGAVGTGLTIAGKVTSTYITPVTTAIASSTDMTSVIPIASGATVQLSPTGPYNAADMDSLLTAAGYTQYLNSQLQTQATAAAGDITQVTFTVQYNEN